MHRYKPEQNDEMHCHNAEQTFYVIDGECAMRFPDGGEVDLKPGQAAMITGGSFYQLENAGSEPMIMMGNRSGALKRFKLSATRRAGIIVSKFKPLSTVDCFSAECTLMAFSPLQATASRFGA
jgi:Cupin domain